MSYQYTAENRLEIPHKYMYTSFEGGDLLRAYQADRNRFIDRIAAIPQNGVPLKAFEARAIISLTTRVGDAVRALGERHADLVEKLRSQVGGEDFVESSSATALDTFDPAQSVETLPLLQALIDRQMDGVESALVKKWLDLLVQRFEVSKKIFSRYQPGFRKGDGASDEVRLYWMFALALIFYYAATRHLKFLSALLKVVDLLSSLPESRLGGVLARGPMIMVVLSEMAAVSELSEQKGVRLDS